MSTWTALSGLSLAAWIYLALLHGRFWRGDQILSSMPVSDTPPDGVAWPAVTAVVPARNEADVIERSIGSLLDQDYPGPFRIVLVDDLSDDGTGTVARDLAKGHARGGRLQVTEGAPLPHGWVGKMWAVHNGTRVARQISPALRYLLLADADVEHRPDTLRRLVAKAEREDLCMVSLMVQLHCSSAWEKLLIPAFVYFFQKLYPFPRINNPKSRTAGAAGGCMLVRGESLESAGGITAIRDQIIDDCALGRLLKQRGPIWLGLARQERSIRPYDGLTDIWDMVARSAYTQLHYSPWLLAGTSVGLFLVYLVPPLAVLGAPLHGSVSAAALGAVTWALMAATFQPTLRLYDLPPARALMLPVAGTLYLGMTLDSGRRHWRGQGARWKGRDGAGSRNAAAGR